MKKLVLLLVNGNKGVHVPAVLGRWIASDRDALSAPKQKTNTVGNHSDQHIMLVLYKKPRHDSYLFNERSIPQTTCQM